MTEWVIAPNLMCYFLLNDIMDLQMSRFGTLVSQRPCGVFYAARSHFIEVLRSNTRRDSLLVLWFDITYTHDTQHTQGPIDWYTHISIYLHHLLCAHSIYLYYTEWIICWYQRFTLQSSTILLLFKNYWLLKVTYICWFDLIRLSSSYKTQRILRGIVWKSKTHHHSQRER